jgi:hypothetical protein
MFLKRRLRRFISKTCPKRGWVNHDDLAIAAIVKKDESILEVI